MLQVLGFMAGRQRLESVEKAWKPVACKTRKQVLAWHETFIAFWAPHQVRGTVKVTGSTRQTRDLRQVVQSIQSAGEASAPNAGQSTSGGSDPPAAVADNSPAVSEKSMGGASQTDPLDDRSGQQWMPSELSRLEKLARRVRRQLQPKPTRRWRLAPNGDRLHTRQTVRNSGKLLGEGVLPAWRSRRREVPNLIILCDVSRSMEAHVALSLRVARAFTRVMPVRSFVFHVRTTEVTELLRHDTPRVQERINGGFSGGDSHCPCGARNHPGEPAGNAKQGDSLVGVLGWLRYRSPRGVGRSAQGCARARLPGGVVLSDEKTTRSVSCDAGVGEY